MPFALSSPAVFLDDADLDALIFEFSHRLRARPDLRQAMNAIIGNRWEDAESAAASFLRGTIFFGNRPNVDGDLLAQAARSLNADNIDCIAETLLECALLVLPLHSAAVVAEIGEELAALLKSLVNEQGVTQQKLLLKAWTRLSAGALMSRF